MFDVKLTTTKHQVACGCACLKMLLDYYGIDVDLDTLIEECGLSVNGCSMTTLMRVARLHGLNDVGAIYYIMSEFPPYYAGSVLREYIVRCFSPCANIV